jgi:spore coat protein CotH
MLFLYAAVLAQQSDDSWKLFDDSNVARADITIDTAKLGWIYRNVESDSEHYAQFRFRNNLIDETVDSIGFRLRGNTSRYAAKKSFKISFNSFIHGRKFHSVEKLNFNGEHNDPSIIRSKLCFDHFRSVGMKASRANHVEVYINGKYYGLYISVEHIDEEFLKKNFQDDSGNLWKCLYPVDLTYLGSDPTIYINLNNNGRPAYELSTNEEQKDFSKLVRLTDILNNITPGALEDSLESVIDVPDLLKYFALNILTGSWDDYWSLMNNYYLYHDPSKDLFHIIPYDYDNTYGVDWFSIDWANADPYNFPKVANGSRPLAEKLMANPQYRNLYTHFIEFIRSKVYNLSLWENHLDTLKQLITPYAVADSFRRIDYGFTVNDFNNSYSSTTYANQHVKYGLKQFVNTRNASIPGQLAYVSAKPVVYRIDYRPEHPGPDDSIHVYVSAFSNIGLKEVAIQFTRMDSLTSEIYPMLSSPVQNSKNVDDADQYTSVIPPLGAGGSGKFSIYVKDTSDQSQLYPRKGGLSISTSIPVLDNIVINEFLADNVNSNPDPNGEHDDWVELYNPTASAILLTGKYMTDNPTNYTKWRYTQTALYINPGEFIVVWCDDNLTQPGVHTNFKLSKSGEYIAIIDTNGVTVLDSLSFGTQKTDTSYGRYPDASLNWQSMLPTPGGSNLVTGVYDYYEIKGFNLSQNYPNPFNPITNIRFTVAKYQFVTLRVYDILAREVATLVNEMKQPGEYTVHWNAKRMPSGVYFYRLNASNYNGTKKLLLLR